MEVEGRYMSHMSHSMCHAMVLVGSMHCREVAQVEAVGCQGEVRPVVLAIVDHQTALVH